MKAPNRGFAAARRARSPDLGGVLATARLDRRTKNLTKRLQPGDIAIIDHADLDRVSADALIRCQVSAAHTMQDLDFVIEQFSIVKKEFDLSQTL